MTAIAGRKAELWSISGTPTGTLTKQACEAVGASTTVFHVTDATKRYLDPHTAIAVYDNDVLQTTGYQIIGGCQVRFASAPTTPITLTGAYLTPAEVTLAQNWNMELQSEAWNITSFGDSAQKYQASGIIGFSGSFERFYEDDDWQEQAAANGTQIIVRLFEDQPSGYCWTGWAVLTNWSQTVPFDGLQRETVGFTGYSEPAYTTDET